jgi:DNA-binding NarL/FixJ family response regulator
MTCIVVENSPDVRESLCYLLLAYGIQGLPAANAEQALKILTENSEVDAAIVDVDNQAVGGVQLLKDLKAKSGRIQLIVHSVQDSRSFLQGMTEYGVHGYLLKPFDEERTAAGLRKLLLEPLFTANEKREHLRVHPDPSDLMRVSFRITASSRLLSGRVANISMGGVAIELFNPPPPDSIRVGWRIPRLDFTLNTRPMGPSGVIVLYQKRILAVRFEVMNRQEKTSLARYIFRRLTAT